MYQQERASWLFDRNGHDHAGTAQKPAAYNIDVEENGKITGLF